MLSPNRSRLAERLRQVRASAFRSGSAFARAVGWQQSRVSKMETGKQLPTADDVRTWAQACRAPEGVVAELLALLSAARVEYVTYRDEAQASGGLAAMQADVGDREAKTSKIAEWQPAMIPGLVQTAEYTTELLGAPDRATLVQPDDFNLEGTVAERMRRQEILYQPGRQLQIVIGEAALRSTPQTIDTLIGQLDRLAMVASLRTVELGIVPFPAMPIIPLTGFCIHDDRVVYVETLTGEQQLYEPDEVAVYVKAFGQLRAAAVGGSGAVTLIRRVADQLRNED